MPFQVKSAATNIIAAICENSVINSIIVNPFTMGILVTLVMIMLFLYVYDVDSGIGSNLFTFGLYSTVISTMLLALHDTVLGKNNEYRSRQEERANYSEYGYEKAGAFRPDVVDPRGTGRSLERNSENSQLIANETTGRGEDGPSNDEVELEQNQVQIYTTPNNN